MDTKIDGVGQDHHREEDACGLRVYNPGSHSLAASPDHRQRPESSALTGEDSPKSTPEDSRR